MNSPIASLPASFDRRMIRLMAELDDLTAAWSAECRSCGRCCDFSSGRLRLYVSSVEVMWLLGHAAPLRLEASACPFQLEGLCGVRPWRPMGCRIYFCSLGEGSQLYEVYEHFQRELKEISGAFAIDWVYGPLFEVLSKLRVRTVSP